MPIIDVIVIKLAMIASIEKNLLWERQKKIEASSVPGIILNTPSANPAVVIPSPLERTYKYQWLFGIVSNGDPDQISCTDCPLKTASIR